MNVKKIRRRCMVLGCKNIDTYAISRSRDIGGNIVLCKSCLAEALSAIEDKLEIPEKVTDNKVETPAITAEKPKNNTKKRGK